MPKGIKINKNIPKGIFSDRLRALMELHGLDQRKLADCLGVSQGTISRYLNGREPRGETLVLLGKIFGVHPQDLLPADQLEEIAYPLSPDPETEDLRLHIIGAQLRQLKKVNPDAFDSLETLIKHLTGFHNG